MGTGLFVSFGGFTDQGLDAFRNGKKLVCIEGREIKIALKREIGIDTLIAMKARRAAETGVVFTEIPVTVHLIE